MTTSPLDNLAEQTAQLLATITDLATIEELRDFLLDYGAPPAAALDMACQLDKRAQQLSQQRGQTHEQAVSPPFEVRLMQKSHLLTRGKALSHS